MSSTAYLPNKNISGFIGSSSKQEDIQRAAALWVKMFYWCQTSRPNGAGCFWLNRKETATQKPLINNNVVWCVVHSSLSARHIKRLLQHGTVPGATPVSKDQETAGSPKLGSRGLENCARFHESWFLLWHVGSQFWRKQQESIQPLCRVSMVQAFRYNVRDVFLAYFGPLRPQLGIVKGHGLYGVLTVSIPLWCTI